MSKGKRNRYSAEFKAKVAKEAMKGEETMAQLAVRFGVRIWSLNGRSRPWKDW